MKIGIVGLPYSGKTTLFEAITGSHGTSSERSGSTHMATVSVPDERLDKVAVTINPKKITYPQIDFLDVASVSAEMERQQAAELLASSRESDGLANVVRWFDSPSAPPHPRGSLDAKRDFDELAAELIVADLEIVERRIEKLVKQATKPIPTAEKERDQRELALMRRMKEAMETGKLISSLEMNSEEAGMVRAFMFLSQKPMLNVLNVGESAIGSPEAATAAQALGKDAVIISAKVEKEIGELDPAERAEFLQGMGIGEPALRRIIRACYSALGLISFITAGEQDCRAWTIRAGENALAAAGKIHSDIARGFIRAEVISYADFETYGSVKEATKAGKMRLEGKEYIVQDADIINIRFKV